MSAERLGSIPLWEEWLEPPPAASMSLQKRKEFGSTSSIGSRGSLSNLLKDGAGNLEESVTKKWLSWILR